MAKAGVLGSGQVAKTLAAGLKKHGYDVMMGSSSVEKLTDWSADGGKTGSFQDAASFGEIIVLSVKGSAAQSLLSGLSPESLTGKTIIDVTNPIADAPPENGVLKFYTNLDKSNMEQLQEAFPQANFVKSFSCVGAAFMVNPSFKEGKPSMFICGNNENAKKDVADILDKFGWECEDMGKAEAARAIEPLCMLWCIPGFLSNQWSHAFKLLRA